MSDNITIAESIANVSSETIEILPCDAEQQNVAVALEGDKHHPSSSDSVQRTSENACSDATTEDAGDTPSNIEPAAESASKPSDKVADMVASVDAQIKSIQLGLGKISDNIVALQKVVSGYYTSTTDSMHHELEKYRKGLLRKMEQELFSELIEIYDVADNAVVRASENPECALSLLEGLRDQIDASLFNRGVERRNASAGEKFDPRKHHVMRPDVLTGDKSLDGLIAATAKAGFDDADESFATLRGGCMKLRPVWVRLYRYDQALDVPEKEVQQEGARSAIDDISTN